MITQQVVTKLEPVDLTAGGDYPPTGTAAPLTSGVMAVSAAGLVAITLRGGSAAVIYLARGQVFRGDISAINAAGTDAAFKAAAGDLVLITDRIDN